jgi:hypothetical protein
MLYDCNVEANGKHITLLYRTNKLQLTTDLPYIAEDFWPTGVKAEGENRAQDKCGRAS